MSPFAELLNLVHFHGANIFVVDFSVMRGHNYRPHGTVVSGRPYVLVVTFLNLIRH